MYKSYLSNVRKPQNFEESSRIACQHPSIDIKKEQTNLIDSSNKQDEIISLSRRFSQANLPSSDSLAEVPRGEHFVKKEKMRERERGEERERENKVQSAASYTMIIPRSHDHELRVENSAL